MSIHTLQRELWIPRPRPEVFDFFSRAGNLERITPPWVNIHVLTPEPVPMHVGALIRYKIKIHGFPANWLTEITQWDPPNFFQDVEREGPYKTWDHSHPFVEENGGTRMIDLVLYELPFGPLGDLVQKLKVGRDVEEIFTYRNKTIAAIFQSSQPSGAASR